MQFTKGMNLDHRGRVEKLGRVEQGRNLNQDMLCEGKRLFSIKKQNNQGQYF